MFSRVITIRAGAALAALSLAFARGSLPFVTKDREHLPAYDQEQLVTVIEETRVLAEITRECSLYADKTEDGGLVAMLWPGAVVELLRDYQEAWYQVSWAQGAKQGWVKAENLLIPPEEPTVKTLLNRAQLEGYANANGFQSPTKHLVIVDIARQKTYVFKGSRYNWTLLKTLPCSTGKNASPTLRGAFTLKDRGLWFYSERLGSGGKYWVRFDGPYLFHSLAMNRQGDVIDDTIGQKSSNGCVRLLVPDAEWFYKNVDDGAAVIIR